MTATVGDSIEKGIGYAFYCYSPHAIWFQHDIVRLEEPAFDPAKYKALQPDQDPNWFENSKVMTEDALKQVQIAYSKSLAERAPAIAELVKNIKLTGDDVSALLLRSKAERTLLLLPKSGLRQIPNVSTSGSASSSLVIVQNLQRLPPVRR